MKKAFALISALTLAAGTAVGLAACEDTPADDTPAAHTHTYGEWVVETPATLFEAGSEYRVCTADDCDAEDKGREEQEIPALGTTSAVADAFVTYNSGISATETGVKLGMSEADGCGASTYFGEEDKVMEFDGENETTISYARPDGVRNGRFYHLQPCVRHGRWRLCRRKHLRHPQDGDGLHPLGAARHQLGRHGFDG